MCKVYIFSAYFPLDRELMKFGINQSPLTTQQGLLILSCYKNAEICIYKGRTSSYESR